MSEDSRSMAHVCRLGAGVPQDPVESYMFANTGSDDVPDL